LKTRQVIEATARIAASSHLVIGQSGPLPTRPIKDYWQLSRERNLAWFSVLRDMSYPIASNKNSCTTTPTESMAAVLAELFATESLTRVWGAILMAADGQGSTGVAQSIARNALLGHEQVRHLAMRWLSQYADEDEENVGRVDRIRRRCERCTDLILGELVGFPVAEDFAHDPRRATEFSGRPQGDEVADERDSRCTLVLASLRIAFPDVFSYELPEASSFTRVLASILETFPRVALAENDTLQALLRSIEDERSAAAQGPNGHNSAHPISISGC